MNDNLIKITDNIILKVRYIYYKWQAICNIGENTTNADPSNDNDFSRYTVKEKLIAPKGRVIILCQPILYLWIFTKKVKIYPFMENSFFYFNKSLFICIYWSWKWCWLYHGYGTIEYKYNHGGRK